MYTRVHPSCVWHVHELRQALKAAEAEIVTTRDLGEARLQLCEEQRRQEAALIALIAA